MPRVLLIFLSKYMLDHSEFVKKIICHWSSEDSIAQNHFLSKLLKNPKVRPFYDKKKIVPNLAQIS